MSRRGCAGRPRYQPRCDPCAYILSREGAAIDEGTSDLRLVLIDTYRGADDVDGARKIIALNVGQRPSGRCPGFRNLIELVVICEVEGSAKRVPQREGIRGQLNRRTYHIRLSEAVWRQWGPTVSPREV